jgi:cation diffusion facilitator family transporter
MSGNRLHRSLRVTFLGMAANALLAAGKLTAGLVGHSYALVADAVESLADVFSSIIVWRGVVVASAPADADHPYGHGKAEPIAAAIVSGVLLVAAGGIVFHAAADFTAPRTAPQPFTLGVLLAVVCIKEALYRFGSREGSEIDSSALQSDAWHHRSDAITSLTAAVGIVIALIGGPAFSKADSIAAVLAAGVIAWNGARLFQSALGELMDTAPSETFNAEIERVARSVAGVDNIEKCIVRKMGYQYFVDLHMEVDPNMTVHHAHEIAHDVKNVIREKIPSVHDVLVHIEPSPTT